MDLSYWSSFYLEEEKEKSFDWYCRPEHCLPHLHYFLPKDVSVLHIGCGSSALPRAMSNEGWKKVVNVDNCPTVILTMQADPENSHPALEWKVMDVMQLEFSDNSFGAVLDKGTVDALMCSTPDLREAEARLHCMVREVHRVLAEGGVWLSFSHGAAIQRERLFFVDGSVQWESYICIPVPPVHLHVLHKSPAKYQVKVEVLTTALT
eukprot:GGOE01018455.1.p1 GENE.GGOE01018455.1~~GGOE01018455.1.p1  ORF type:complete len:207 (+),score=18.33 GGOE01018455.1:66-686(+)